MRLIDTDAFKDYYRNAYEQVKHTYTDDGEWAKEVTNQLCTDIDKQPTIEPQKWIPCSERLPGVETDVLLQFSRNMCVGFLDQDNGWKIYSGGCWFTDILEGDLQPTAWMPLPEPYKEGNDEIN